MKRPLFGSMLLALLIAVPLATMAQAGISVNISLPPPVVFEAPPDVIVMPDTRGVYAVPDTDADMYFWNGWWWRLWQGRWYRSHYYNRGWSYYRSVPGFYFDIDPGWRGYYRDHNWSGHQWNYERIPHGRLQQNWRGWQNDRHWEKRGAWGVQNYQPRPQKQRQQLRRQRQQQYHTRPDVQRHQQQRSPKAQKPQRQPQVQQPRQQPRERTQQLQRPKQGPQPQQQQRQPQAQRPHGQGQAQQPQHSQPRGNPEGGGGEHRR